MLIVIAKLATPDAVGAFALSFALTAPAIQFANLSLRGVLATDAHGEFAFAEYLALRLALLVPANLLIGGVAFWLYDPGLAVIIVAVGVAKSVEAISDVHMGLVQQRERMQIVAGSLILKGVLSVLALGCVLAVTGSVAAAVVSLGVAWLVVLVAYDIPFASAIAIGGGVGSLRPKWKLPVLIRLMRLALPLGFATLLASLLVNVPRFFVERTLGVRELGFFAAMAYLMIIGARVVTALGESASPRLAKFAAKGDVSGFRSLIRKMTRMGAAVGVAGVGASYAFGERALALIYRPEYAEHSGTLVLLMGAAALGYNALFLQYGLTAARKFECQPRVLLVAVAACVISAWVLVPSLGMAGAALAMAVSSGIQYAGYSHALRGAVSRLAEPRNA